MLSTEKLNLAPLPVYQAHTAYQLREFAQSKRYQMQEITAHTVDVDAPCRREVEGFIAAVFKQVYGAEITHFMPKLVALRDQNGVLMAAFGLRHAHEEKLFLEQYIDVPIEVLVSQQLGREVTRSQITCIGNLAVANPRNASILISHIIQYSLQLGIEWCVATAHHSLQNGLIKSGRDVYAIAEADYHRLPESEIASWGTYYKNTPQIVAIRGRAEPLEHAMLLQA
jgi:Thermostable hemolysin